MQRVEARDGLAVISLSTSCSCREVNVGLVSIP